MEVRGRDARVGAGARRGFIVAVVLVILILAVQLFSSIASAILASRDAKAATHQIFGVVADVTIERVDRYSQAAEDAVGESAYQIENAVPLRDVDAIAADLYSRMYADPQVGAVKVGWATGDFIELKRDGDGYQLEVVGAGATPVFFVRTYDSRLQLLDETVVTDEEPYDPRVRPWYLAGAASSGTAWTSPYLRAFTGERAVSAVRAITVNGELVAVVAADLMLTSLATVLDGLPVGTGGQAIVFDAGGLVVAAPGSYAGVVDDIALSDGRLATAADLGVTELSRGAATVEGMFGRDGDQVVFERAFPADAGPTWIVQLRATRSGLAPALGAWEGTVLWTTSLSALLVAVAVALIIRVWGPLAGMRVRATTDALTGLANRHELRALGPRILASAASEGEVVCVAILDVDDLKTVNDTLGHKAGDDALIAVGRAMLELARARDLVARMGGDEFVVIQRLGNESDGAIASRIDHLRARIARRAAEASSVSGVTVGYSFDRAGTKSLETLLREADGALVRGKAVRKGATYDGSEA